MARDELGRQRGFFHRQSRSGRNHGGLDQNRKWSLRDAHRADHRHNYLVEIGAVIHPAHPQRVRRAGAGEGDDGNQDGQEGWGTTGSPPTMDVGGENIRGVAGRPRSGQLCTHKMGRFRADGKARPVWARAFLKSTPKYAQFPLLRETGIS